MQRAVKIVLLLTVILGLQACGKKPAPAPTPVTPQEPQGELIIEDIKEGTGVAVQNSMRIAVHYVGTLEGGPQFDSSRERGKPFIFTIGIGSVIQGWEQGILGMKPGGVRKLTSPPHLAYGDKRVGRIIPPNATLVFEIELLEIFQ